MSAPLINDIVQIMKRGNIIFFTLEHAMFESGLDAQNPTIMKPDFCCSSQDCMRPDIEDVHYNKTYISTRNNLPQSARLRSLLQMYLAQIMNIGCG
jgi:hypothetical protein